MRVKGGGRKKSWEAMPVDDDGDGGALLFQDIDPNAPFAVPEHQPFAVTEPQPQIEPENRAHAPEQGNDGDGEGEDGEGEGEEAEEGEAEADDENKERTTKLDEGFYEIEAIRRKRVRKGQLQYLIKWRGWPETANTWEPLENLQSVSDVIDAFEESLRTGKQRKRKRKSGTPHTQPKKKQQQCSTDTIYNVTDVEISNVDKALSSSAPNYSRLDDLPPPQQYFHSGGDGENNGHINNTETVKNVDSENLCANVYQQISERREEHEYDPKLSELKATVSTNIVNSDKLSVHFQEAKAPEVNGPTDGLSKVDVGEPVQGSRSTGAKRRKSGSVKRFKQEAHLSELGATQNAPSRISMRYAARVDQTGVENLDYAGENSGRKNKIDESREAVRITKILKPMGYSTSLLNNVQDVSVTFLAMRSDGTEVIVDNKFLKVNHPLLLINFYEQHLRYSPSV